jgi:GNAT superfamily N-acetyltransferase
MSVTIVTLTGDQIAGVLDDLARLRIAVFRDWPYLYDGDLFYERRYLSHFAKAEGALVVGAFDGARLVGAATGAPMEGHAEDFARPFAATGLALTDIFYCAESVLMPEYRGRGLGHAFFDRREAQAKGLGRRWSAFCGVVRPENHPARPADYRLLDDFWRARGYEKMPGILAEFAWKDLGHAEESKKSLQFWIRDLTR